MRGTGRLRKATGKTAFHKVVGPKPRGTIYRGVLYMIVESIKIIRDGRHVRF